MSEGETLEQTQMLSFKRTAFMTQFYHPTSFIENFYDTYIHYRTELISSQHKVSNTTPSNTMVFIFSYKIMSRLIWGRKAWGRMKRFIVQNYLINFAHQKNCRQTLKKITSFNRTTSTLFMSFFLAVISHILCLM